MDSRAELRRVDFSGRMAAAVVAALAALVLAGIGGYVLKSETSPTAAAGHVAQGQFGAAETGSAWNFSIRHSGAQSVEGPAPVDAPSALTRTRSSGTQIVP